ncbi:YqhG family protein, partial [Frankia sp. Cpl3]|nr:YqhG family protein [Frankia sp. Cpl3]
LYLGVNMHQPRVVHDFYPFLQRLSLSPSIPDYFYTLDRRISLQQALAYVEQEAERVIARQDQRWAEEAINRLEEELAILEAYYA